MSRIFLFNRHVIGVNKKEKKYSLEKNKCDVYCSVVVILPIPILPILLIYIYILPTFFRVASHVQGQSCEVLINSLAPGRFQFNFRGVIFKPILLNGGWGISYEIALRCMPLDPTDDQSTLVQVMAWCRQATSHCLGQCWPRSMSPNGITRPKWVKMDMDHKT